MVDSNIFKKKLVVNNFKKLHVSRFCIDSDGFVQDMDFEIFADVLCDRAVNKIKNRLISNLQDLMSFLAVEYGRYKHKPDKESRWFGLDTRNCSTRIINLEISPTESNKYSSYFLRFEDLCNTDPSASVYMSAVYTKYVPVLFRGNDKAAFFSRYTATLAHTDNNNKPKAEKILLTHGYLRTKTLENILHLLESDFASLKDDTRMPEKDFFVRISKVYWFLINLHIYVRGNAAISDFVIEVLARLNGFNLGSFKKGVIPDLEAMLLTLEEFSEMYCSFFTKIEPHSNKSY